MGTITETEIIAQGVVTALKQKWSNYFDDISYTTLGQSPILHRINCPRIFSIICYPRNEILPTGEFFHFSVTLRCDLIVTTWTTIRLTRTNTPTLHYYQGHYYEDPNLFDNIHRTAACVQNLQQFLS